MIDHKPLPDKIAEFIRNQIIQGKLKPGEKILEAQLAEDLNISRTPIREAIRLLECEGFVELLPRRGAIVKEFSEKDLEDTVEVKACLETLAAELVIDKVSDKIISKLESIIDNELKILNEKKTGDTIYRFLRELSKFHDTIIELCDNRQLVDLNIKIENHIKRYRFFYLSHPEILQEIPSLQKKIIESYKEKDISKLRKFYTDYIKKPFRLLVEKIKNVKS